MSKLQNAYAPYTFKWKEVPAELIQLLQSQQIIRTPSVSDAITVQSVNYHYGKSASTVSITSPVKKVHFDESSDLSLTAEANDPDGAIIKVDTIL
jgi:hypothetical protein